MADRSDVVESGEQGEETLSAKHGADAFEGKTVSLKLPRKKHLVSAAVVLAVVLVGIGFWSWHNMPGFCTAVCHSPMDESYLATFEADPYQPAVDKWGNPVAHAKGMLSSVHSSAGYDCMDCHVPSLEEQVTEAVHWVSGDYYNPLSERDFSDLVHYRGVGSTEFCLNSACHDLSKADLTEVTANYARNPHSWHHIEYDCNDCHKGHRASVMVCTQCHDDSEVPYGWISYQEEQELPNRYMSYGDEKFLRQN